jgi:coproporphyrinogen III oxidase
MLKNKPSIACVKSFLTALQNKLCDALAHEDGLSNFQHDDWHSEKGAGSSRVITDGPVFETGGVNFSHVHGDQLPTAAKAYKTQADNDPFEAMGVSLVLHSQNPYVPTVHANFRFFYLHSPIPQWWFGGGFDLTPYFAFKEDCIHWHKQAYKACAPFGENIYPRFKEQCDTYFYLPHRQQARGIGGLIFDDYNEKGFEHSFGLTKSIADHFLSAYLPIVRKRKNTPYSEPEKHFQRLRQGRYVEFNLAFDRGTRFGLEFGGRTESILVSLPANPSWAYQWPDSAQAMEKTLNKDFLQARDWLTEPIVAT